MEHAEECTIYRVVQNSEGCFCIWPCHVPIPDGWSSTGFLGTGIAALNQVAELWRTKIS